MRVVKKFGGSSLRDTESVKAVARHVARAHAAGQGVVVVVSAMGKTTDELMGLAHQVSPHPDRRELDMLLTAGERISMALLAMAVRDLGVPATSLTGSQCGIITNDRPGAARIVEVRPYRVEDALNAGHVVIVAGFQGVSYRREVTTLGRGGSDTTAVALAAAVGASACEIYSDVDGVYSADPRVIIDAKRLTALSHDEMLELARAGAKVLAEDAVAWARINRVALFVRAADGRPGETMVRVDPPEAHTGVVGVATRPDAWLWRYEAIHRSAALAILATAGVAPLIDTTAPGGQALLLVARDVADSVDGAYERLCADVAASLGAAPLATSGTLVSVVGTGVGRDPSLAQRFDAALSGLAPDSPRISQGLTRSVLVEPGVAEPAARALHAALITEELP